mmetsp:Transcript_65335/g.156032  ORF Transcript_65335/g.156032 Transcript_65335/m.156032 type:complete len:329 (+) Transcript_65335:586-1572(+)
MLLVCQGCLEGIVRLACHGMSSKPPRAALNPLPGELHFGHVTHTSNALLDFNISLGQLHSGLITSFLGTNLRLVDSLAARMPRITASVGAGKVSLLRLILPWSAALLTASFSMITPRIHLLNMTVNTLPLSAGNTNHRLDVLDHVLQCLVPLLRTSPALPFNFFHCFLCSLPGNLLSISCHRWCRGAFRGLTFRSGMRWKTRMRALQDLLQLHPVLKILKELTGERIHVWLQDASPMSTRSSDLLLRRAGGVQEAWHGSQRQRRAIDSIILLTGAVDRRHPITCAFVQLGVGSNVLLKDPAPLGAAHGEGVLAPGLNEVMMQLHDPSV